MLWQDLALEQGALRIELAQLLLLYPIYRGALRPPALGEDPRATHHRVGVDAVDPDAVLAQLGRQQPDLVSLIGL